MHRGMRFGVVALAVALLGAACAAESSDSAKPETRNVTDTSLVAADTGPVKGAQRLHYEFGPIDVLPGQNNIAYSAGSVPKPTVPGWITRIKPDLRRADGSVPRVDVIHLHHGVWLNSSARDSTARLPERFFAAGEEKTIMQLPEGYGYRYSPTDNWTINYMIHNLTTEPDKVWITYDLDFIPADSAAAADIQAARPIWMDVQNGSVYPVFDVLKGSGQDGRYEYPDDATDPYAGRPAKNRWTVDRDGVLVATAGHLHPGGLYDDLYVERSGATAIPGHAKPGRSDTAHLFRSKAHYYEPAGAVSWDVAMTATKPDWRVAVKAGDVLEMSGDLRLPARVLVRVDGHHGGLDGRWWRWSRSVHDRGGPAGTADPRSPSREQSPWRQAGAEPVRQRTEAAVAAGPGIDDPDRELRLRAGRSHRSRTRCPR